MWRFLYFVDGLRREMRRGWYDAKSEARVRDCRRRGGHFWGPLEPAPEFGPGKVKKRCACCRAQTGDPSNAPVPPPPPVVVGTTTTANLANFTWRNHETDD